MSTQTTTQTKPRRTSSKTVTVAIEDICHPSDRPTIRMMATIEHNARITLHGLDFTSTVEWSVIGHPKPSHWDPRPFRCPVDHPEMPCMMHKDCVDHPEVGHACRWERMTKGDLTNAMPFERTFAIGDQAEHGYYNLSYYGAIRSITAKTVIIEDRNYGRPKTKRLSLRDFARRNRDFDVIAAQRRNSETMSYL